jgi:hypothetical protein
MLNDVCINGAAALIHDLVGHHQNNRFALLSSYLLGLLDRDNATLWRNTHLQEYWKRDTWILPIHRLSEVHWVLCLVFWPTRSLFLFDSLSGSATSWTENLQVRIHILHLN